MDEKAGPNKPVRPKVLTRAKVQQFGQPGTSAIDAAFDRAEICAADPRCLLVGQSLRPDQQERLALLDAELGQGRLHVGEIQARALFGHDSEHPSHGPIRIGYFPATSSYLGIELIAQNGEEPSLHTGTRLELIEIFKSPHQGRLDEVVRISDIA